MLLLPLLPLLTETPRSGILEVRCGLDSLSGCTGVVLTCKPGIPTNRNRGGDRVEPASDNILGISYIRVIANRGVHMGHSELTRLSPRVGQWGLRATTGETVGFKKVQKLRREAKRWYRYNTCMTLRTGIGGSYNKSLLKFHIRPITKAEGGLPSIYALDAGKLEITYRGDRSPAVCCLMAYSSATLVPGVVIAFLVIAVTKSFSRGYVPDSALDTRSDAFGFIICGWCGCGRLSRAEGTADAVVGWHGLRGA